ncbi:MAG: putative 2OG-Fe(II) oxygenase [Pseudomonadota bacterium]|nr:putative 2OG-Fe(II) oxygenase [Pseudomonadota bacterium]
MNTRSDQAALLRAAVASTPSDRISWHNLAAAEGDLGRVVEAEAAARRAISLGIRAPETRLVHARALQGLRRLDEAQRAFEEAVKLRPGYVEAHRDLAQLIWMRTADKSAALSRLDSAVAAMPRESGLHLVRSIVLEFAGDRAGALAASEAGLAQTPTDSALLRQAAHLLLDDGDAPRALALAQRATNSAPAGSVAELATMCEALLAAGRIPEGDAAARKLVAAVPHDQHALALQATAWRLAGDPRYPALYDYSVLVDSQRLDVPIGYASLDAFLRDLAADLESLHAFRAHPLQQSVRGGSQLHLQAPELARPLVNALFQSITLAVGRHVEKLGTGGDPLRARNTGRFGFSGAWSVRLRSGGHHADHVHPHGWISSACYIALPSGMGTSAESKDRAGWLRLGKPPVSTVPALDADHYVRPEAGRLVLFPAYMWHGVEPFEGESPRLSVAFDVVPA